MPVNQVMGYLAGVIVQLPVGQMTLVMPIPLNAPIIPHYRNRVGCLCRLVLKQQGHGCLRGIGRSSLIEPVKQALFFFPGHHIQLP